MPERLRTLRHCIFTGGVVEGNGICSAAFCESAALRENGSPSQSPSVTALPKGEPLALRYSFRLKCKACGRSLPLGGAVAQRLRGFKSAEPEKTVKRSSRRTGVNLQFFPVGAYFFGVKRGEQPLFRGSSASKSLALFWFSFGVKREHPSASRNFPRAAHASYFSAFAVSGSPRASTCVSSACTFALVASVTASTSE